MNFSLISIVIPVFNEQERIANSLDKIIKYITQSRLDYEVFIGDDGSNDNTVNIVNEYTEKFPNFHLLQFDHRGKGAAIKDTLKTIKSEYCFICDADLSMPINQLDRFIENIEPDIQILYGSREHKSSRRFDEPNIRYFIGRVFNIITRLILQLNIKDTQCGFKLFNLNNCRQIFEKQTINGFAFDSELLYLAKKYNLNTKEIPIDWYYYGNSKVRLTIDSIKMFIDLIKVRLNNLFGHYN